MKKVLFSCLFLILFVSCTKDDDQTLNPVDALPPATQVGAQTFGCLIDGEPFYSASSGSNNPNGFIRNIDGSFTFVLSASRSNSGNENYQTVSIGGINVPELEAISYLLVSEESQNLFGSYLVGGGTELDASTSDSIPGRLTITRLDQEESIISGTFEFTILDNEGQEIKITEGRFDINYIN